MSTNLDGRGTVSLATYLFTRLRQLGVRAVHMSYPSYNPIYAFNGHARVKGISALFTQYGVGELNALNAVAGAYVEYSPMVHIVGCPARKTYRVGGVVQHSLGDGKLRVHANIWKHYTVAQAALFNPMTAIELIDQTLQACVQESRPVYLEMPSDMVTVAVQEEPLATPLHLSPLTNDQEIEDEVLETVLNHIYASKQPYVLVDGLAASDQIVDEVNRFASTTGFPTLSYTFGGGIVDGSLPNYHGIDAGKFGTLDFTPYTSTADLCLLFSPFLTNVNMQSYTNIPPKCITISFGRKVIGVGYAGTLSLYVKSVLRKLLDKIDTSRLPNVQKALSPPDYSAPIYQDTFNLRLSSHFRPKDVIICANATPLPGGRGFVLPLDVTLIINSSIWLSIGHMLPAAQGVALAQRELNTGGRTILFEGDGSFQVSAQELSTVIKHKLDAYIFLINNSRYTYERMLHGEDQEYKDVARWNYLMTLEMMGAPRKGEGDYTVDTYDVSTWGDLMPTLEDSKFWDGKGPKMVNVRMDLMDMAKRFKPVLKMQGDLLRADPGLE
ncbi:pyruvate decarboxylase [Bimuria novae-zelandiae CBS 107.79]|uniref:Pyruvate decarboxylase n=1 Tax=Bimuria novae-zelandiae CBS 107.79 TaxID=1447943 RepID=A0A6A5V4E4_9PLEO|nr:pyruvate decarboxylase [Bimuria novae-zelandiae CBS 107.79]